MTSSSATPGPSRPTRSSRARAVLDLLTTGLMLVVTGFVLWLIFRPPPVSGRPDPGLPRDSVSLEGAPILGDPSASIVIIEFSDFECRYCVQFAQDIWPEFKARWVDTGVVQFSFRHLPLPSHSKAQRAAQAAECAVSQDRFWPMHDQLFLGNAQLSEPDLKTYAMAAGLNVARFDACMVGPEAEALSAGASMARSLNVTGTPTFLVGKLATGRRAVLAGAMYGALPIEQFDKAIKALSGG